MEEDISKQSLLKYFENFKKYSKDVENFKKNHKCRMPNFPEHISENIIMLILNKNVENKVSTRIIKNGDLYSKIDNKIECKSFSSKGPISFGPTTKFDKIYFLDATQYKLDKFILYKVDMNNIDFENIKVNKKQIFKDQFNNKRRPRILWTLLYPQIQDKCNILFNDFIYNI